MEINLNRNELAFIQSEFNYKELYGIEPSSFFNNKKVIASLTEKKMLFPVRENYELCNELRLLFGSWTQVRYAMTRPDIHSRNNDIFLLSDEKTIIYFKREKDKYYIRFTDMDEGMLDYCMSSCMQLGKTDTVEHPFNIKLSMNMLDLIIKDGSSGILSSVAEELGVPVEWLSEYREVILSSNYLSSIVLTEDLTDNIGCLTKIVYSEKGIYGFKHVTAQTREHAVIIKGDTQFVVDCMYNF